MYYVLGDSLSPMQRGTYCWTSETIGQCVDMIAAIYEENQHNLFPSHTIELLFFPPVPDSVSAGLQPGSDMMAEAQEDILIQDMHLENDGRLFLSIPENAQGRYILYVFASWEGQRDTMYYTRPTFLQQ